ncbi:MAG TPA: gluconeogenesis factor YvcK family protein [Candidatus Saccharimonadales bacterium]|nr:gluconeogenesis factor YvcK family protein [Candidatus Saccharimonadales bacterium]
MSNVGTRVVVIGGGTGSFTLLSSLKNHAESITALVNMADDGGSTGVLRDELGVLPPGDVRQCLVALSQSPKVRDLFNYRFEEGTFSGHAFGNLFLTALEKMTGSFAEAVETASEVLRVKGTVVPATLDNIRLVMEWPDVAVVLNGEKVIDEDYFQHDPRRAHLRLEPNAKANPAAIEAIKTADLIVVAPGDLYTSLGPLLVVDGIGEALLTTTAKVAYVCNLVTKRGQTDNFSVSDHAAEIERFAGGTFLDYVLYNRSQPDESLTEKYESEQAYPVEVDDAKLATMHYTAVAGDFLAAMAERNQNDMLHRSLIRHDAEAVAETLIRLHIGK